jgi:hypothetical protein
MAGVGGLSYSTGLGPWWSAVDLYVMCWWFRFFCGHDSFVSVHRWIWRPVPSASGVDVHLFWQACSDLGTC